MPIFWKCNAILIFQSTLFTSLFQSATPKTDVKKSIRMRIISQSTVSSSGILYSKASIIRSNLNRALFEQSKFWIIKLRYSVGEKNADLFMVIIVYCKISTGQLWVRNFKYETVADIAKQFRESSLFFKLNIEVQFLK